MTIRPEKPAGTRSVRVLRSVEPFLPPPGTSKIGSAAQLRVSRKSGVSSRLGSSVQVTRMRT